MQRLTLSYEPEDDEHGELVANVQSGPFAGQSTAWFTIEHLKAFDETLGAFPIVSGSEPRLIGGFFISDDELKETHVSIRIEPAGPQGRLRVKILLATSSHDPFHADPQSVRVQFLVNYSDLGTFQRNFSALLSGERSEACLEATPT